MSSIFLMWLDFTGWCVILFIVMVIKKLGVLAHVFFILDWCLQLYRGQNGCVSGNRFSYWAIDFFNWSTQSGRGLWFHEREDSLRFHFRCEHWKITSEQTANGKWMRLQMDFIDEKNTLPHYELTFFHFSTASQKCHSNSMLSGPVLYSCFSSELLRFCAQ